jgi:hypothetical protein
MLRSSSRYKALDETGLFGSACRHEFPAKFLDMKHGERLVNIVWNIAYYFSISQLIILCVVD